DHSVAIEGGMMMKGLMSTQTLKAVLSSMRATLEAQLEYARTLTTSRLTKAIAKEIATCKRRLEIIQGAEAFADSLKDDLVNGLMPRELWLLIDFMSSLRFPDLPAGNIRLPGVEELETACAQGKITLHPLGEFVDETHGGNGVFVSFSGIPGKNYLGEEVLHNAELEIRRHSVAETCRDMNIAFRLVFDLKQG
ncbi:MAG: hypothetical protein ABIJ26_06355, partial [Candidatus Margulisiibacteriota bacterium]